MTPAQQNRPAHGLSRTCFLVKVYYNPRKYDLLPDQVVSTHRQQKKKWSTESEYGVGSTDAMSRTKIYYKYISTPHTPHPTMHFLRDLEALQELDAHTKAQSFPAFLLRPHNKRQTEVNLEARNGMCVHETKTSRTAWQFIC
jgi:hypothetical protein